MNNNASAVLLGLSAIANGREVIVSRGEAVEIGGGFRIPDVLRQSGAALVEVGTTNRTYVVDYESAITPDTAATLKVHTSNFRVIGFTHEASVEELSALGAARGIPVLHDQGSGCLLDTTRFGLAVEPMVQDSIAAGADLVFFSGDKLLGGPQAGIVAGKSQWVTRLARHPFGPSRAYRQAELGGPHRYASPLPEGRGAGEGPNLEDDLHSTGSPGSRGPAAGRAPLGMRRR